MQRLLKKVQKTHSTVFMCHWWCRFIFLGRLMPSYVGICIRGCQFCEFQVLIQGYEMYSLAEMLGTSNLKNRGCFRKKLGPVSYNWNPLIYTVNCTKVCIRGFQFDSCKIPKRLQFHEFEVPIGSTYNQYEA